MSRNCNIAGNITHVSIKAKRACIIEHGSVGSAKGTPEGEKYRLAYSATKMAIARHERHSFAIECKRWFENQDTRLMASNPMVRSFFYCISVLQLLSTAAGRQRTALQAANCRTGGRSQKSGSASYARAVRAYRLQRGNWRRHR